ncbi:MAG TPA: ABC transporter ATP-binding protein [Hyphomicrobiaceae bacterium]|nr:ABC transporter ATP-binding protein [Hyphomicrobiaceae bacterium]
MGQRSKLPRIRLRTLVLDEWAKGTLRRFVADWVAPRWREIAVAFVFTAGLAATTGGYPLIIKHSFDSLMRSDSSVLPWVLAAVVLVTSARSLFLYLHQVASARIIMRMTTDLQKAAFAHLIGADFARLTRETTGHLVSRLTNDLTSIQQAAQISMIAFVRDLLSVFSVLIAMFYLDWMLTLVVIGIYPLAALPMSSIGRRLRSVAKRTHTEVGDMTARLTELLAGARLIKAFRLETYATERLNSSFEQIYRLRMKGVRVRGRTGPALEALAGLVIAGVIAFAYWRIAAGISTVGDFMGFITALLLASQPIKSLGSVATSAQDGLAAAERVYELLDEKPTIIDGPQARPLAVAEGTVVFDNVGFAYATAAGKHAVNGFSLTVPGGKTVALVGRSGAGKSTIINLAARLFDVGCGRILIDGQDLRQVTLASLGQAMAIVSQEVTLFDDTIRANIALGRLGASEDEIVAAAKAAAAYDFIMAQPQGLGTMIGDSGLRLSGGQRQRVALARAILKNAPILLLDEATSALDAESERLVQTALTRFTRDRTTLVIAHRLSTVQRADLICLMDHGRIVETGTHAELIARDGAYARLCRSQVLLDLDAGARAEAAKSTAAA